MKKLIILVIAVAVVYVNYMLIKQLFYPDSALEYKIIPGVY